jgi:3-hydroxyisobutyrate dehydrogenase
VTTAFDAVGMIGLGNMGMPMAERLLNAGRPVVGFDTAPQALERFVATGGTPATSAADVGARSDCVILMLPNSDIVESVLVGDGVISATKSNALIVDMSSSEPLRTRQLAQRITGAGRRFVDAPVSGGVSGAVAGTLTIMAGGVEDDVTSATEVLRHFGQVTRIGDIGSGHALKALNNLMSATHLWISCEALAVAEAFGIDPAILVDVVNRSTGKSWSTEKKLPAFILSERFDSGFALQLMVKDITIAAKLARELGASHALADTTLTVWSEAANQLPPGADHTEIAKLLRKPGVEP